MAKLELSQQKLNSVKKAEEYYNALRTNIQLSGNNLKVIAVTSVDPSEGKKGQILYLKQYQFLKLQSVYKLIN